MKVSASEQRTIAVIQARMSSSRLTGKVLMPLAGKTVLDHVIDAAMAAPGLEKVIVATSVDTTDDAIVRHCAERGTDVHRGSLLDVLDRFLSVIEAEGLDDDDAVVRLTADCPLLDPWLIGLVVERYRQGDVAFVSNTDPVSWPDGLDCEMFSVAALRAAGKEAVKSEDREHVGPFIRRNRARFPSANVRCPSGNYEAHRWTLDTQADYNFLVQVSDRLGPDGIHSFATVVDLLRQEPALFAESMRPHAQYRHAPKAPDTARFEQASLQTTRRQFDRARRTIPLGAQTFSKSFQQFPKDHSPLFVSHGFGGHLFDIDGNEYVDLIAGLLPVVLGYCDPDVDGAVRAQLDRGMGFSLATELEAELAETLVRLIPCAEMVRFGKNGSDVTSAAVRVARAATGRERVAVCGYHGWHDWYIGSTTRDKGVPKAVQELTSRFEFNNLSSLERLVASHPDQYAAVVMEVMNASYPDPGFLEGVRDICDRHGIVLVFDEIVTGFRFHLGGAQALFGVTPDLACFGKAMANGMPLSAIVGRETLMQEMQEIFFSGTFGGECLSLAASLATISKLERENGVQRLWSTGEALQNGVEALIAIHGLQDVLSLEGVPPLKILSFKPTISDRVEALRTLFQIEMIRHGVLIGASHNVMSSHNESDVEHVLWAYDKALAVLASGIASNGLEENLPCPPVMPVFQVRG